jgi:DNA-binding winged helix-turn-helix (wHTH) protein/TolB-like protein/tetratricopeptide (TPR) repeat protein
MRNPVRHFYEFGPFRLDQDRHRLLRDNEPVPLSPKAIEALLVLVQNPGKMLEREQLMRAIWADSFVEDANLTVAISHLRKALGQDGGTAEYIETIPRVGYRFVASVRQISAEPMPLILEKHTVSKTVIEEELFDDDRQSTVEKVISSASPFSEITPQKPGAWNKTAALLVVGVLIGVALATGLYLRNTERQFATAANTAHISIRSIAVLPPKALAGNADDPSLSLGLADALIMRLGGLRTVVVRPTSSMSQYIHAEQDSLAIGRTLGVDAVLEGSYQREGDRIRITMQLLRARDGAQLWSGKFDDQFTNIFDLQDSISKDVALSLGSSLSGAEERLLAKRPTENVEAYQLYLKGRYFWNKRGEGSVKKAAEFFEQAVVLDPDFALAYVGLADSYGMLRIPAPEAEAAARKALELDPDLAEAHASLGLILMFHQWNWEGAERELSLAIERNPNYATAHHWYGVYLSLKGRLDEAKAAMRRALEIDPTSLIINADLGQLHYFAREYDKAEAQCKKVVEMDPNFVMAHLYLLPIYVRQGKLGEANQAFLTGLRLAGPTPPGNPIHLAMEHAEAGKKDRAIASLERAWERHMFLLPFMNVDPIYDGLRSDPRFLDLLRRMGLAPV